MLYRNMCGEKVSTLGLGCMRLPVADGDYGKIDTEHADAMLEYAVANGVNYLDTAWMYHKDTSESWLGSALKRTGFRDRVFLATKMPVWLVETESDFEKLFSEQLNRLQTTHIDFYLLHALNSARWEKMQQLGAVSFLEKARKQGRIGHIGFSFHDDLDTFKNIIDSYSWEFCLVQYNYMDINYQQGRDGVHYARDRGVNIAIMEPVRGGALASLSDDMLDIFSATGRNWSSAGWALRWVWNEKAVSVVLSGMSSMEQLVQNIESACSAQPGHMTEKDLAAVAKVRDIFLDRMKINCTKCGYCLPCPQGVAIPKVFELYNSSFIFQDRKRASFIYNMMIPPENQASACNGCGRCESLCPQKIPVSSLLPACQQELNPEETTKKD